MIGHIDEYKQTLDMLEEIDADLKLVIAGNHDISLDEAYYKRMGAHMQGKRYDADMPRQARELWTGARAKKAGVTYLDEGTHTFTLPNGARLSVYASPYQPEFCVCCTANALAMRHMAYVDRIMHFPTSAMRTDTTPHTSVHQVLRQLPRILYLTGSRVRASMWS